jgi:regulator of sigma E protease
VRRDVGRSQPFEAYSTAPRRRTTSGRRSARRRRPSADGLIIGGLGTLVSSVDRPDGAAAASGPIGTPRDRGRVLQRRTGALFVAGILSANLAVVNILPFPPLDGGRMLMITLKRLFGARISLRAEQLTYVVGFVFLFGFIIWVSGFDIARSLGGVPPVAP